MKQILSSIKSNRQISADFYELTCEWPVDAGAPVPGQFLTIRASTDSVPLLRRPFAYSGYDPQNGTISIIYQKRGRATELLCAKSAGEQLDIIGPLGVPFPLLQKDQKALLVAGGIGLGPILFLADTLKKSGVNVTFIFGSRTSALVPQSDMFAAAAPTICTDDGSRGFRGTTADYLATIDKTAVANSVLYCCGPMPMLKACHRFSEVNEIDCWVSVEQIMACGVGACMGCVVKVKKEPGYARACKDGPVFNHTEIKWE